jgi:hypothetical protein
MRNLFAILGLVIGFVAIGVAAFERPSLAPEAPKEDKRSLKELAAEAGKKLLKEKVLKESSPAPSSTPKVEPSRPTRIAYMLLGLAAMAFGGVAWIRKENLRMACGAIAVGLVAVAWEYVLVAVAVAIFIMIVCAVMGS